MTTRVRSCLSYDYFSCDFINLKVEIVSIENITIFITDDIMMLHASDQVFYNMRSYDFYEMTLPVCH